MNCLRIFFNSNEKFFGRSERFPGKFGIEEDYGIIIAFDDNGVATVLLIFGQTSLT
jgi:hypothetical protein